MVTPDAAPRTDPTLGAAMMRARVNVRRGLRPTTEMTTAEMHALYQLEREVMRRLDDRRRLPKTISHGGYRFRVVTYAGGHLIDIVTYDDDLSIFGARPMPMGFRRKVAQ